MKDLLFYILTERFHNTELRWVVIIKGVERNPALDIEILGLQRGGGLLK